MSEKQFLWVDFCQYLTLQISECWKLEQYCWEAALHPNIWPLGSHSFTVGLAAAKLGINTQNKSEFYSGLVICSLLYVHACTGVSMPLTVGERRIISPAQDCLFPCWHWCKSLWEHMARQPLLSQECPCGGSSGTVGPLCAAVTGTFVKTLIRVTKKLQKTFGRYHSTKKNNTSISLLFNCSLLDSNISSEIRYYHRPELVLWEIRLWLNTSNAKHILLSD